MVAYKTIAGQAFPIGSIGKADLRLRVQNTTEEECRAYAQLLEQSGYCKRAEKQISAGSECPYNVNLFYTFQNDINNVFIFWDAAFHTVFITYEPRGGIPENQPINAESTGKVTPTVTQLRMRGMCYVIQLGNGEFIIVDGGVKQAAQEKELYDFLKEKSGAQQPTVALWIFTHSHKDHIGLATNFLRTYKDLVMVKAFAYQFANCDKIQVAMESVDVMKAEIAELEETIHSAYTTAEIYTLHTGQSYFFAGLELEVLYSLDDTYPYPYLSFNDTSAAFRVTFKSGKNMLFLGDCQNEACKKIAARYGDYLKSDTLQLSHHGLIGGDKGLYKLIDPDVCFWAVSKNRFLGKTPNQTYQWCLGEGGCDYNAYLRDPLIRKRTHYHASVTTTVDE